MVRYNRKICLLGLSVMLILVPLSYAERVWVVGAIPQQSAGKLIKLWKPFLAYISKKTGHKFVFRATKNFTAFEQKCALAEYDFVYLSPAHYIIYHNISRYNAIAKAKNKKIRGIIVVHKSSQIKKVADLHNQRMGFPAKTAFAATMLPKVLLKNRRIHVTSVYSKTHDNVYYGVARQIYPVGGGIIRTFNATSNENRKHLRILWTSKAYTPHAVAAHQRVPPNVVSKFRQALLDMARDPQTRKLYLAMKIKYGFEAATDSDWDDVRALGINLLSN